MCAFVRNVLLISLKIVYPPPATGNILTNITWLNDQVINEILSIPHTQDKVSGLV